MNINLTEEQNKAIYTRDKNMLVSASAGSGKTFVLVQRILHFLIEEEISIDKFLIVTFTNAAAAEMRERFAKALMSASKKHQHKAPFIISQIQKLHMANISTLHAFCKRVIKEHFYHIGIDPNFKVGNQYVLDIKFSQALDETFEESYVDNDDFKALLSLYSTHRNDDALKEHVKAIYSFSRAHPYPDEWFELCIENYALIDENSEVITDVITYSLNALHYFRDILLDAKRMCSEPYGPADYIETLDSDLRCFDFLDDIRDMTFDMLKAHLEQIVFVRLKTIKKANKDIVDERLQRTVKACRDNVKKQVKDLMQHYFRRSLAHYIEDMQMMSGSINQLILLVKRFADRYQALKLEDNLLDFNDLEQYAIALLNVPEVALYYQKKFNYIFVDEYQDSNRVQEEIVNLIKRKNNLFLVGDVKQSIYKFRMAEPKLFLEKFYNYQEETHSTRVDLNHNFRTHPDILKGINTIFSSLLTTDFGSIDYVNTGLLSTLRKDFKGNSKPVLSMVLNNQQSGEPQDLSKKNLASLMVAHRIEDILNTEFFDVTINAYRTYQLRDIVILMRSVKGNAQILSDDLSKKGIPVIIDEEDSYFDLIEVATIINVLRIIDNCHQDIPLLSVMRSFIGQFNDVELASIRTVEGDSYYDALIAYVEMGEDFDLVKKISDFINRLSGYRNMRYLSLSDYIWWLLEETGYYAFVYGLEDGVKRVQHFKVLTEKAEQFEADRQSGLHHFVNYLDQLRQSKINYGGRANTTSHTNAVKVMSIHKSKGLEFPVVILMGLDKGFNFMDLNSKVVLHPQLGLVSKYINSALHVQRETLAYAHLRNVVKRETVEEEVRLLYVALTRAVYRLEVIGTVKSLEKSVMHWQEPLDPFSLSLCKSYQDWMMKILMHCENLSELDTTKNKFSYSGKDWHVNLISSQALVDYVNVEARIGNIELNYRLEGVPALSVNAFNGHEQGMPAKISVTSLKDNHHATFTPKPTTLSHRFDNVDTSLEKGNIYHLIMECITCEDRCADDVINRMLKTKKITESALSLIAFDKIEQFFSSSLFKRMCQSKHIWREQPFVYEKVFESGDNTLVQGIVDAMFLEGNEIVVVDYKSDYIHRLAQLKNRYSEQLHLYSEAIEDILGIPVKEKIIYSIYLGKYIII